MVIAISQSIMRKFALAETSSMRVTDLDDEAVVFEFFEPNTDTIFAGAELLGTISCREKHIAFHVGEIFQIAAP